MKHPTKESFLKNVENHYMTILKDDGIYRHLRFNKPSPNSWDQRFEIITYPNGICYSGDMGSFVFERTYDMLGFFRHPDGELGINSGYWAEKCVAECVTDGVRQFDIDQVRSSIRNYWESYFYERTESDEAQSIWESIEKYILNSGDSEIEIVNAIWEYDSSCAWWRTGSGDRTSHFSLDDFFVDGCCLYSKTYRFLWCLWALSWAVIQYDKVKAENACEGCKSDDGRDCKNCARNRDADEGKPLYDNFKEK